MIQAVVSGIGILIVLLIGFLGAIGHHYKYDVTTPRTHMFEDEEGNKENPFTSFSEDVEEAESEEYRY